MNSPGKLFTFHVDRDARNITIHLYGVNTDEVFADAVTALLAAEEYTRQDYTVLVDALEMTVSAVTADGLFSQTERMKEFENRMAVVMRDGRGLGVAKIFEVCSNAVQNKVAVFRSSEDAREWLRNDAWILLHE
jgi:hypothetical protein